MPYFVTVEDNATVLCLTFNESMYTYAQDLTYKGGGDGEGGGVGKRCKCIGYLLIKAFAT